MDNERTEIMAVGLTEAARMLNIGRNSMLALVHSKRIHSVRVDRKILIPRKALEDFLNKKS